MDWDDLKLFLAVAREGSISGGARKLGVRHSTVSRRMRALEAQLGVRLIDRKKSGCTLTTAGESMKSAACKVEHEVLQLDGKLGSWDAKLTGELRISVINSMASGVLMPMFAGFCTRHPEVDLHILTSNKNINLVERDADVAIRLTNTPTDALIGTRLGTVATAAYASHAYIKQLHSEGDKAQWLGANCCNFHQNWTKKMSHGQRQHVFIDDLLTTTAALLQHLGVAYLPCFIADREPGLGRFSQPDPQMNLGIWLLFHPDLKHTARVLAFRDHMVEQMKAQAALFKGLRPRT